jgi:hypothetical protein
LDGFQELVDVLDVEGEDPAEKKGVESVCLGITWQFIRASPYMVREWAARGQI